MSEGENKLPHGGRRDGAGRKTSGLSTTQKRIPEQYSAIVDDLISFLNDNSRLSKHTTPNATVSGRYLLRSKENKLQHVSFVAEALNSNNETTEHVKSKYPRRKYKDIS